MSIEIATAADLQRVFKNQEKMQARVDAIFTMLAQQQDDSLPEWVTVKRAAEYLGVTPATVRRHCNAGMYETSRRGGKNIFISRGSLIGKAA